MSKRIYVGNLPYSVDDAALRDMFASFGEVTDARVISDRDSGRSKGFGFVEMSDEKAADEAIKALHDTDAGGRKLVVNEARERTERTDRPRFGGGSGGGGYNGGGNRGNGGTSHYAPREDAAPAQAPVSDDAGQSESPAE